MAGTWTLEARPDGAGILWADTPGEKVNLLSASALDELAGLLDGLAREGKLRALVVASRKPGHFFAGADVKEVKAVRDPQVAYEGVRRGQLALDRIARLPIPTVAAIEGVCFGGGLELALACAHRVVSDHPKTSLGLVEVKVGIIPGWGGTQRLPRVVGLQEALRMILNGATADARKAQRIGLADARVPEGLAVEEAVAFGLRAAAENRPRTEYRAKGLVNRILEGTGPGSNFVFKKARAVVMQATRGHYPAPLAAIEAVREGRSLPMERALEVEARFEVPLVLSEVSKNLIRIFFMTEAAKSPPDLGGAKPLPVSRVGVLGAGVMGGGIAQLAASKGFAVRMKDLREEFLGKGLAEARRLFERRVKRRRLKRHEAEAAMARITPALGYEGFSTLDAVMEAVVEKLEVKRAVLGEVEEASRGRALFATNTSSLPISLIAQGAKHPGRVVGMHFFNPVEKMPLIEVIRGKETSDEAVATVYALALRLGKVPVLCEDGPGFLVNRLLMPYLNESAYLLLEGAGVVELDEALLDFGMPMGPAHLLDEVGLDVAFHVGSYLETCFPDRMASCPLLRKVFEARLLGKKGGAGFYLYKGGKKGIVNPEVQKLLPAGGPRFAPDAIVERTVLSMVNEASRILDEGIVKGAADVDLGMIMGTGFPPFRGGLLRYADTLGLPRIAERLHALAAEVGPRYAPAPRILAMAKEGSRFFPGEA